MFPSCDRQGLAPSLQYTGHQSTTRHQGEERSMQKVTTAVIPVAGLGTRLLPASKAIPKEMVPVVDRPLIQYVVEEAASAGITRIVLVTRAGKEAIENHFDRHYELEAELERKSKTRILQSVRGIVPPGVELLSVRQPGAAGLGDAIRCAAGAVGEQPFVVMLPDVMIHDAGAARWNLRAMIQSFERSQAAQILVESVPRAMTGQYGIVDVCNAQLKPGQACRIYGMVEKPAPQQAPSTLAIVGRYVLPARVMQLLRSTGPGAGGEVQLTDALHQLLGGENVEALMMRGRSFDCGSKLGYVQATLSLALQDADIAAEVRHLLVAALQSGDHHGNDFALPAVA
jgi:UTP--glucose-1-phosphate uridylyltransferase